jgi:enoyl-CoA hydratase/carnithine racemase
LESSELVLVQYPEPGVAVIVMNNPPLNLHTLELTLQLEKAVMCVNCDEAIRAVVLTGVGERAFSAGSDVKEFPALRENFVEGKLRRENAVFSRIAEMRQPVVAAICGHAMGGGCELALCCDMRLIDENARIGLPEINLGSFPGSGGMVRLPKVVGPSLAMELMCLGTILTAGEAKRIGLVDEVVPAGTALQRAIDLARKIAAGNHGVKRSARNGANPH